MPNPAEPTLDEVVADALGVFAGLSLRLVLVLAALQHEHDNHPAQQPVDTVVTKYYLLTDQLRQHVTRIPGAETPRQIRASYRQLAYRCRRQLQLLEKALCLDPDLAERVCSSRVYTLCGTF